MVLKEMLKIDSSGMGSSSPRETINNAPSGVQQQNRRRSSKKLGTEPTRSNVQ